MTYKGTAAMLMSLLLSDTSVRAFAYYNRGNAYVAKKNRDAAVEDYSQAIEINPNYPEAHNNRALLYRQQQKYDTALADLNRAIELNPEDGQTRYNVYFNRGLVYFDLENYIAIEHLRSNPGTLWLACVAPAQIHSYLAVISLCSLDCGGGRVRTRDRLQASPVVDDVLADNRQLCDGTFS